MRFAKYQALGNDYLVIEAKDLQDPLTATQIKRICDRHYGVGSDGILLRKPENEEGSFCLRIFNPDGTEAEKSGNGLRIFARYLWDQGQVSEVPFRVETPGGTVTCQVLGKGRQIVVDMGVAVFDSTRIPVAGLGREVLRESLEIGGETLKISAVSMGNPHCIVHRDSISEIEAKRLGPLLETHPFFPKRTNVQFMQVLDPKNIKIEIWERGAGYTLASGTSSCAAAAVAYRLGLCDDKVTVHMAGGELLIEIGKGYEMKMTGPVGKVMEGCLAGELFEDAV